MDIIARIHNDFSTKFGLPRQSSLAPSLLSRIVFEPGFRNPDALRGLDGFSHIWLIWDFSEFHSDGWSPTVRPPRLGGNTRLGVFATRSPNRPNPIGLSCVKLESIDMEGPDGPVITVSGADLMDGTPIFDIKPYLPAFESHPDARDGFVGENPSEPLEVVIPGDMEAVLREVLDETRMQTLREVLAQDPRPAYHNDPGREYGLDYAGLDVHFKVDGNTLTVVEKRPVTMAVLNLTPDSFWAPSRWDMDVLTCGADIVDIGAVSTRPGAAPVSEDEEWTRLEPVLRGIADRTVAVSEGTRISIDTTRSGIVRKAFAVIGPFIVNDISAGLDDREMLQTVGELGLTYVAMHKRGGPQTMDALTDYPQGIVNEVISYFEDFSKRAALSGIKDWILDPGFGFAKTEAQNIELLRGLGRLRRFGRPILAGIADKRFTHGRTSALQKLALLCGADILRVHVK